MENTQAPTLIAACDGVLTRELHEQFNKLHLNSQEILPNVVMVILSACELVIGVALLIGAMCNVPFALEIQPLAWLLVIVGAFGACIPLIHRAACAVAWKKNPLMQNLPYTIRFFEGHLVEYSPRGETAIGYKELHHVLDSRRLLMLYISPNQAFLADKTQISPEQLSAVLQILYNNGVKYKYIDR